MTEQVYHKPAMLGECMDALQIKEDGVYVDLTFGGGGHSREILKRLGKNGRLYVFDQDEDAMANAPEDERVCFCHSNFRYFSNFLDYYGEKGVDGILADLGVSFHHFDEAERGFSFRFDGPLDMRMNRGQKKTAADLLNEADAEKLAYVFKVYGELNNAKKIADAVCKERLRRPFARIEQLNTLLEPMLGQDRQKKDLAKAFQAIRIEVNDEMGALRDMLGNVGGALKKGGRFAVLTYHSLEDRMVKNYIKSGDCGGGQEKDFYGNVVRPLVPVNGKPMLPTDEEVEANPRARSAKLRIAEKA